MKVLNTRFWWVAMLLIVVCWALPLPHVRSELRPCPIEPTQQTARSAAPPAPHSIWSNSTKRWIAVAGLFTLLLALSLCFFSLLFISTLAIDLLLPTLWLICVPLGSVFGIMACIQLIDSTYITHTSDPQAVWQRALLRHVWSLVCGLFILPVGIALGSLLAPSIGFIFLLIASIFLVVGFFGIILMRPKRAPLQQYE